MGNETILMTIALGLSALLILGGGFLMSKAIRSDKAGEPEEEKRADKRLAGLAALMMTSGLLLGGGAIIANAVSKDNVQLYEPEVVEQTGSNPSLSTQAETTEISTTTTTTTTTTTITTTETTTTETTVVTTTESVLLPLSEVKTDGKGNEGGFYTEYYSDHSIILDGIITDERDGLTTYDSINGSHASIRIPKTVNGYTVRALDVGSLAMGYSFWTGVKEISVPADMRFTKNFDKEISLEKAKPFFSKFGIKLTTYE